MTKKTALVLASPSALGRNIQAATRVADGISDALRVYISRDRTPTENSGGGPAYRLEQLRRCRDASAAGFIGSGYWLREIERTDGKAEAQRAMRELRIERQWASYAVRAFHAFNALPDVNVIEAIASLGPSKAVSLLDFSPDELTALAQGEEVRGLTYETVAAIGKRDLQQSLKDWKREHDDKVAELEAKLDRAQDLLEVNQAQLDDAKRALGDRAKTIDTPDWYRVARAEVPVMFEGMALYLAEMQKITQEYIVNAPQRTETEKAFRRKAFSLIYHSSRGFIADLQMLMQYLVENYDVGEIGEEEHAALLSLNPAELLRFSEIRQQIVSEVSARRQTLAAQRKAAEQPRGRGRPKGAKNKPKSSAKAKR